MEPVPYCILKRWRRNDCHSPSCSPMCLNIRQKVRSSFHSISRMAFEDIFVIELQAPIKAPCLLLLVCQANAPIVPMKCCRGQRETTHEGLGLSPLMTCLPIMRQAPLPLLWPPWPRQLPWLLHHLAHIGEFLSLFFGWAQKAEMASVFIYLSFKALQKNKFFGQILACCDIMSPSGFN